MAQTEKSSYDDDAVKGCLAVNPNVFSMSNSPYFYELGLFHAER